jgi:hypothetical protein
LPEAPERRAYPAGPDIGKDDARKVVLTFEGRNVDLNIEGADGFIRLLHGETKTNRPRT